MSPKLTQLLEAMTPQEQTEVETFFSNFVPRSRVKEAINALLAARELSFTHVGNKSFLQVTPPKQAFVPRPRPQRVGG